MEALRSVLRGWRGGDGLDEAALVSRARAGDEAAVRSLIGRNNQRLYRIARAVLHDEHEAEDVVQETYVRAFTSLERFRGEAAFSTWLTSIALNEARARLRRARPTVDYTRMEKDEAGRGGEVILFPMTAGTPSPEAEAAREQVKRLLEDAVEQLPEAFRLVFILRDVEGVDTQTTASLLSLRPETVKTRLHRARRLLRAELQKALAPHFSEIFPFGGRRCASMAERVLARLRALGHLPGDPSI